MARLTLLFLLALTATAQQEADQQLKEAGVCARCHVVSVVEWGMSRHYQAGTNCVSCHGASEGHVVDERNNIKPERMPRGEALDKLCRTCHPFGCSKSRQTGSCASCHHYHAMVNPKAPAKAQAPPPAARPAAKPKPDPAAGLPGEIRVEDIALVLVPGGEVTLGSDSLPDARPVHTLRLPPFYLSTREITEAQWKRVMGGGAGDPSKPATGISWNDAQAFVRKLKLRLPTEAEWELAAQAGGASNPAFGLRAPRPVGQGGPSKLGLYDQLGNVWEWCSSLARPYPYDREDGREDGAAKGLRVLRGGGYFDIAEWVGPATRHSERPDRRLPWVGFRVARSAN